MASSATLWIVCPVYLDVQSFQMLKNDVVAILREKLAGFRHELKFVVVDDSAGRDPEMKLLQNHADVRVLTPPFNLGHQRAIVFGVRKLMTWAEPSDWIVTMDSDGEDRAQDLPAILTAVQDSPIVLARRTKRSESLKFKLFYTAFKLFFRSMTGLVIKTGNYAAFQARFLEHVIFHPHFDLCYSSSLLSFGFPIEFVPCPRGVRYGGQSRMTTLKLAMHGFRMLLPFADRIAVRAMVGFGFLFGTALLALVALLMRQVFGGVRAEPWALYFLTTVLVICVSSVIHFVTLFIIYSQASGFSFFKLDRVLGDQA